MRRQLRLIYVPLILSNKGHLLAVVKVLGHAIDFGPKCPVWNTETKILFFQVLLGKETMLSRTEQVPLLSNISQGKPD